MDLNIPSTSAWLRFAQDFDADFHLAVASAVADKNVNLGKTWPKTLKKANLVWADSLFIDLAAVGENEADELATELSPLEAHVKAIRGTTDVPRSIDSSKPRVDMSTVTGATKNSPVTPSLQLIRMPLRSRSPRNRPLLNTMSTTLITPSSAWLARDLIPPTTLSPWALFQNPWNLSFLCPAVKTPS